MIETTLLKILVVVWISGHPPVKELLHTEYSILDNGARCEDAAKALRAHAVDKKGVKVKTYCVPALTRGA